MNKMSKIITLIAGLLLGWTALDRGYQCFFPPSVQAVARAEALPEVLNEPATGQSTAEASSYNFKRMLTLIERTQDAKQLFQNQFNGTAFKQKPMDIKLYKELLSDLYREKVRLERFIWAVKVQYKGEIPAKLRSKLLYYQNTIDVCIRDIELILRRV